MAMITLAYGDEFGMIRVMILWCWTDSHGDIGMLQASTEKLQSQVHLEKLGAVSGTK